MQFEMDGIIAPAVVLSITVGLVIGYFIGKRESGNKSEKTRKLTKVDSSNSSFADSGEYKMVFIVRQDLGMGKGKAAAQCCHAAIDVYCKAKQNNIKWVNAWESIGCAKVALKCPDEETLVALSAHARVLGIDTSIICDAGRTQIPSGSKTVAGIGPAPVELIDKVTGHLKLF